MTPDKLTLGTREIPYEPLIRKMQNRGFEIRKLGFPDLYGIVGAGTRDDFSRRLVKGDLEFFLKAASDENRRASIEIRKNIESYRFGQGSGFFPNIIEEGVIDRITYYIADFAGTPMTALTREELRNGPLECIATTLEKLYARSARMDDRGATNAFFKRRVEDCRRYLEDFLIPAGAMPPESSRVLLDARKGMKFFAEKVCMNTGGELTPEHVFLNPSRGVVIIDPRSRDNLLGDPCFDLSMLALLTTDINKLTYDRAFYDRLKGVYLRLSNIMRPKEDPEKLWELGILRQCLLSSRFRISSDPNTARILCEKASEIINRLGARQQ